MHHHSRRLLRLSSLGLLGLVAVLATACSDAPTGLELKPKLAAECEDNGGEGTPWGNGEGCEASEPPFNDPCLNNLYTWCAGGQNVRDLWTGNADPEDLFIEVGVLDPTFAGAGFGDSFAESAGPHPRFGKSIFAFGTMHFGLVGCPVQISVTMASNMGPVTYTATKMGSGSYGGPFGEYEYGAYEGHVSLNGYYYATYVKARVLCGAGFIMGGGKALK